MKRLVISQQLLALIPLELLFPVNKVMNIILVNPINCAVYYQSLFVDRSGTSKQKIKSQ